MSGVPAGSWGWSLAGPVVALAARPWLFSLLDRLGDVVLEPADAPTAAGDGRRPGRLLPGGRETVAPTTGWSLNSHLLRPTGSGRVGRPAGELLVASCLGDKKWTSVPSAPQAVNSRTNCETSWATGLLVPLQADFQFLGDGVFDRSGAESLCLLSLVLELSWVGAPQAFVKVVTAWNGDLCCSKKQPLFYPTAALLKLIHKTAKKRNKKMKPKSDFVRYS